MQISLIEFSVENFKVFKEKATLSMVSRKGTHTFINEGENLLRTSFIYGPNASGKTSILDAFGFMKRMIQLSANIQENPDNKKLPYLPFLGSEDEKNKPTSFGVTFSLAGDNDHIGTYQYAFSFSQNQIISERLLELKNKGESVCFQRDHQEIKVEGDRFKDMKDLRNKVRDEALFLSTSAQLNNRFALSLLAVFNSVVVISAIYPLAIDGTAKKIKGDPTFKEKIISYLRTADFYISGANTREIDVQGFNAKFDAGKFSLEEAKSKEDMLVLEHPVYDAKNHQINTFKLDLFQESMGTQKFLSILGPIINALETGQILFIDEFDNSLHPLLTKFIVDLFESEAINKNNAQLIVTTHDTSLLSYKDDFIRDQFWFTDKTEFGGAKLFSLAEFELRNDTEYGKKYLEGRFGALPFIGSVEK